MPETGAPRDEPPIPESSFARLNHFVLVTYRVLSANPGLLVFLGINAMIDIVLVWGIDSTGTGGAAGTVALDGSVLAGGFARAALGSLILHYLQCSLLVSALAVLRGEPVTPGVAFRIASSRLLPIAALALIGILFIPFLLVLPPVFLGWFALDMLALMLVADTPGKLRAYLVGAARLIRRRWQDVLMMVILYLLALVIMSTVASRVAGEDPSRGTVQAVGSASAILHNLILSFIYVYGARLYIFAVRSR